MQQNKDKIHADKISSVAVVVVVAIVVAVAVGVVLAAVAAAAHIVAAPDVVVAEKRDVKKPFEWLLYKCKCCCRRFLCG